jgi:hypothetical protein
MKTLPLPPHLRAVRPALSTAGGSKGLLLPKNMIHETIRDKDEVTELETFINAAGSPVIIVRYKPEEQSSSEVFVFECPDDIDWLVKRLRTLASIWRCTQEEESDNDEEVDQ